MSPGYGCRPIVLGIASVERVARVARRARARGHAIPGLALRVHAALAVAHVGALVVHARLRKTAFRVRGALAATAPRQRVANVAGQARAHRPLFARVVVPGLALGVLAARVLCAQVGRLERTAPDERVAGHRARAAAHRRRSLGLAVGVQAAHVTAFARVHAPIAEARRTVGRAVAVRLALGLARQVRIAEVALKNQKRVKIRLSV